MARRAAVPHLLQEIVLDGLFPGRQHQLEIGAVADIGADRPGAAMDGLDRGESHRQGQAVEIEVRVVVAAMAVAEDAEGEAPPGLGMDRAVEEGSAVQLLSVRLGGGKLHMEHRQTGSAGRHSRPHCGSRRRIRWPRTISTCRAERAPRRRDGLRPRLRPGNVPGRDRRASRAWCCHPASAAATTRCSRGATGWRSRSRRRPRGGPGRRTSRSRRS